MILKVIKGSFNNELADHLKTLWDHLIKSSGRDFIKNKLKDNLKRIREMFAKKTRWFNSCLVLSKLPYGRQAFTDIYRK